MMLTQHCQIWNCFTTLLLCFCCEGLKKTFKLQKILKFEEDSGELSVEIFFERHSSAKIKKSSKVR